jgi:hypothetical protein
VEQSYRSLLKEFGLFLLKDELMAAIIETVCVPSGISVYAIIRDQAGLVWNGSSFEAYNSANWATYAVALVEQASSSYFKAAFPSAIAAGKYSWVIHQGSPATLGDVAIDSSTIDWSGSIENYLGLVTVKLPTGSISSFDPTVSNVNLNSNQTGVTVGTVNAFGTSATSSIKTQIDTALNSDPIPELSSTPNSTPTMKQALMLLFMALRNKRTSDANTVRIYNASGALIATAIQSDNGTVYSKEVFS